LQAVIMAGGRGQRLQPLTSSRPKPLVPFFGRPLLAGLVDALARQGVEEVFITAGHLGGQIHDFVSAWRGEGDPAAASPGPRLHVAVEARPRGTAGAVADLLPHLRSPFAVVSGDAVLDLDLPALERAHRDGGQIATLCLAPTDERLRFGTVVLQGRRVTQFLEKPSLGELTPGLGVNTGCYVLERDALADVDPEAPVDFALDVFPRLLRAGHAVGALVAARYWRDIGTLDAYRDTHFEGLRGALPWPVPPSVPPPADGPADALQGPVHFAGRAWIGRGARLVGPLVVGDGCQVGPGATVARSVLLAGSRVGAGASIVDCVLDEGASVPSGWKLAQAGVSGHGVLAALRRPLPAPRPRRARPWPVAARARP
jgi:NDP-sugar pyrophosphorylase family protein